MDRDELLALDKEVLVDLILRLHERVAALEAGAGRPPKGQGTASRRMETDVILANGQSVVVGGLAEQGEVPALLERLFAHKGQAAPRRLVLVVTAAVTQPLHTAANR